MKIVSLGQAGFLIEDQNQRIIIDPYLSNYVITSGAGDVINFARQFPPPFMPTQLGLIEAIFVTHDHADHCDPQTILPILRQNPACIVIGPQPVLDHLSIEGVHGKQLELAEVFKPITVGKIRFTAYPSAHYDLNQDPITGEFPYLGYVIELGERIFYHSGDTILYEGLVEFLRQKSSYYDVCFLPVNGRDQEREAIGIIGNLEPEEAVEMAVSLNSRLLIPTHNDLFAINCLDPERLNSYAKKTHPNLKVSWLSPGEEMLC